MVEFAHTFVSIAPDRPVPLAGRAGVARSIDDAYGTLEANILAIFSGGICSAVIISIDVLFVGRELSDILVSTCADFGVADERVLIVATHTHSAPALEATKPELGRRCDSHFAAVRQKIVKSLSDLLNERPQRGKLSKGQSNVANVSVNRRLPWRLPQLTRRGLRFERSILAPNEHGPVAPLITALLIQGQTTAVVWHYTCHPTGFPEHKISADYPGIVRKALRQRFGEDTTSIFLQGFTGDIRPVSAAQTMDLLAMIRGAVRGPRFHGMSMEGWLAWAEVLAKGVMQAIDAATPVDEDGQISGQLASTTLDRLMVGADRNRLVQVHQLYVLGERIVAVSGEPLLSLRELCPETPLLVGYCRDVFGYWPRDLQVGQGGYEINGFKNWFGVPHKWQPKLDHTFSELVGQNPHLGRLDS